MRRIPATEFKAACLALLDDVAATGDTIVVTKHGKPVAKLVPLEPPESLVGSVTYLVPEDEVFAPLWDDWEPDFP
jgi:prevent-host-death family protein